MWEMTDLISFPFATQALLPDLRDKLSKIGVLSYFKQARDNPLEG